MEWQTSTSTEWTDAHNDDKVFFAHLQPDRLFSNSIFILNGENQRTPKIKWVTLKKHLTWKTYLC